MKKILFIILIFVAAGGYSNLQAQNYSGLWIEKVSGDYESLDSDVFIKLVLQSDGSYICKLYYNGDEYDFSSSTPYSIKGKEYDVCVLYLSKINGKSISFEKKNGCELHLFHNLHRTNRISFVNNSNPIAPSSVSNFYNSEIATQNALAKSRIYERQNETHYSNELVGTQWMHINKYGQLSCIITFVSENKVHIKNLIRYSNSSNAPIHVQELDNTYTYDQLNKRGIKYETDGNSMSFVYSNNSLIFTGTYDDGRPARMEFYPYFDK